MGKVIARTQFDDDYDPTVYGIKKFSKSLTQQNFKEECDINNIVKKYEQRGFYENVNPIQPTYGDFSHVNDYLDALNRVSTAEEEFMALPADVRSRFANDPGQLIEFLNDEKNRDEAIKLHLIPEPTPVVDNKIPQTTEVQPTTK